MIDAGYAHNRPNTDTKVYMLFRRIDRSCFIKEGLYYGTGNALLSAGNRDYLILSGH